jgi:YggT family protein
MTVAFLQQFGFQVSELLGGIVTYTYYILFGFIIASILFSWFPGYPSSSFMQAVYDAVRAVTNPILMPIRARVPMLQLGGSGSTSPRSSRSSALHRPARCSVAHIENFINLLRGDLTCR